MIGRLVTNVAALGLMAYGVWMSPPAAQGVALVLAAGLWFIKPHNGSLQ